MATIEFFMVNEDAMEFAAFLIDRFGVRFVPENHSSPEIVELTSLDELRRHLADYAYAPRYFLLSECWSKFPLCLSELNSKGHHYFYVMSRHGGPAFDWILPRTYEKSGTQWIVPGSISDFLWYMVDERVDRTIARPSEMKEAFSEIARFVRKRSMKSVCREKGFTGAWISKLAVKEYEKGTWLRVGDLHFEPKMKG